MQELEEKAGTLPIFFALFILEAVKVTVTAIGYRFPFALVIDWMAMADAIKFLVMGSLTGIIYVYDEERKAAAEKVKEKGGEAKEKAKETTEKAKEKAGEAKEKASDVKDKATGEENE